MMRRLPFGWRRVTDDAVRLPIVMTFVVAMFAATVGLVWFGCARRGRATVSHAHVFPGNRTEIRRAAVAEALRMAGNAI